MNPPIEIKRPSPMILFAKWGDGLEAQVTTQDFRKACKCAHCTGESVGDKIFSRPKPVKNEPGAFELKELNPVGNYAVQATWGNGHDTGIYTWDYFRDIFENNNLDTPEKLAEAKAKEQNESKKIRLDVL
jgi:DUF971 family protein